MSGRWCSYDEVETELSDASELIGPVFARVVGKMIETDRDHPVRDPSMVDPDQDAKDSYKAWCR